MTRRCRLRPATLQSGLNISSSGTTASVVYQLGAQVRGSTAMQLSTDAVIHLLHTIRLHHLCVSPTAAGKLAPLNEPISHRSKQLLHLHSGWSEKPVAASSSAAPAAAIIRCGLRRSAIRVSSPSAGSAARWWRSRSPWTTGRAGTAKKQGAQYSSCTLTGSPAAAATAAAAATMLCPYGMLQSLSPGRCPWCPSDIVYPVPGFEH